MEVKVFSTSEISVLSCTPKSQDTQSLATSKTVGFVFRFVECLNQFVYHISLWAV